MREANTVRKLKDIIESYSFDQPFAVFLRDYFRRNPQMGSNDRRIAREWTFDFFRLGKSMDSESFERKLLASSFLCSTESSLLYKFLSDEFKGPAEDDLSLPIEKKLTLMSSFFPSFRYGDIFPMYELVSPEIMSDRWIESFLKKPFIYIRTRRKFTGEVIKELNEKGIKFQHHENTCILSFDGDPALDKTDSFRNGLFEIQDISSQETSSYFHPGENESWWDVCAGSGGKSLMLLDEAQSVKILATDSRPKILESYAARMKKVNNRNYCTIAADVSSENFQLPAEKFDGIIADVPCSGSGTWARSPEWLQKDVKKSVQDHFIPLQRKIVANAIHSLKEGFPLIYITCSVFSSENEENVEFFIRNLPLRLEKSAYLKGFERNSDTLFVARMIRLF